MRIDKAGDEEIIVSVAGADFVLHVEAVGAGGVDEGFGLQFVGEQRIGAALIDEYRQFAGGRLNKRCAVVSLPSIRLLAQIGGKRLLSASAGGRMAQGGERGNGGIAARIFQSDGKRAVPAHAETCDAALLGGGEMPFHPIGQFAADMAVHLIMRRPRLFDRIDVKSRALSDKFVRAVADMAAARRGVGENDDDVPLRGKTLDAGLAYQFRAVAVQSRQEIQDRRGIAFQYLRRQVDAESHIGSAGFGKAAVLLLMAVEHFGTGKQFEGHGVLSIGKRKKYSRKAV